MENTTMKNFTFLLLMLCTPSFFSLQAMGPDYGDLKYRGKKDLFSIHSADQENRDFLFEEEHIVMLKKLDDLERLETFKKQIDINSFKSSIQKIKADAKAEALRQQNTSQQTNGQPKQTNSDSDFESDSDFVENNEKEAIRCAEAYKVYKENKSSSKKSVHFFLPDDLNAAKALSDENRNNHQFAALCIKIKQERHTESPLALLFAAGKESPFSETTTPSLSPIHAEEEDTLLSGDQKIRTVTSTPQIITSTNKTRKANSFENEYNMLLAQQDDKVLSETSETDEGDFFFR